MFITPGQIWWDDRTLPSCDRHRSAGRSALPAPLGRPHIITDTTKHLTDSPDDGRHQAPKISHSEQITLQPVNHHYPQTLQTKLPFRLLLSPLLLKLHPDYSPSTLSDKTAIPLVGKAEEMKWTWRQNNSNRFEWRLCFRLFVLTLPLVCLRSLCPNWEHFAELLREREMVKVTLDGMCY